MEFSETKIKGNLQSKVMLLLKEEPLCGTDLMKKLDINSPGTIYPVLHSLEKKGLIFFETERTGRARKKVYKLTEVGVKELNQMLTTWTRLTCCDWSFYIKRFIHVVNNYTVIKKGEKILCTLDADLTKEWLKEADVTSHFDLENMKSNYYDKIISFIGVGTVMKRVETDAAYYLSRMQEALKEDGIMVALEIEKTDNLWAERYFVEISGFKEHPGMVRDEFESVLGKVGFKDILVYEAGGVLVSVSKK
ncbi:transcriptional regulator PadR-like family protein [archaeon]|nr:transcriptional regulator PadR-like family protein [archaeon]